MRYIFNECILDTEQYLLYRTRDLIQLQPKVFQVLLYLLMHRDRVISKSELIEQIWPDQFISDATLEGVIKTVRRSVGDDGRRQWCIQTRRGQGYQFIAPLRIIDDAPPSPDTEAASPVERGDETASSGSSPLGSETPDAIRRQLTVMGCEIVEAAHLAQRLDPEELRDVVQAYQSMCQTIVEQFEGVMTRENGMSLVVYFGYPHAHEDSAYRAIRAGLEIVDRTVELNHRLAHDHDVQLSSRVGIHTGLVVAETHDSDAFQGPRAMGSPVHVANQIRDLADPETVLMSAETAEQVQGLFISREIESPPALDVELSTVLIQVIQPSSARNRFDVARHRGLTPLVGREEELGLLRRRWEQVCQGQGHGVLIYGEAGIGKSRLVEAFRQQVDRQASDWVTLSCTSTTRQSAFYPVLAYLRQRLQWMPEVSLDTRLDPLEAMLQSCGLPLNESMPLVAPLLAVPLGTRYPSIPLPPNLQHRKLLDILLTLLIQSAGRHPGLMIWEDVHWADASTLELLSLLLDQIPTTPILVLLTFRPDFHPPWPLRSYLAHLALDHLSRDQVVQLIAHVTSGLSWPDEVIQEVFDKSDGVPLFVEELTKLILDSKATDRESSREPLSQSLLAKLPIPATLQDLLMMRLDRMGTARRVLQYGSMLGREFSYDFIQAVAPLTEAELQESLTRLVEAELLYQQGVMPQSVYLFKHALIQDTAYQSMLKRQRREYHGRIAQVMKDQFPQLTDQQPELLARHYSEADQPAQAVIYWQKAGQAALHRLAYREAIQYSKSGLELLADLPKTAASIQQELVLQRTLGMTHAATKGFADLEAGQAYRRAMELCQQVGDASQLLPILGALRQFHQARGELQTAHELATQQLDVAQQQQHSMFLIQAYANLGAMLFYLGDQREARDTLQQGRHLLQGVDRYDVSEMRDSRVHCLSMCALALLLYGEVDQALACHQEALNLAQALGQPFSLSSALGMGALFHVLQRDYQDAQQHLETVLGLAQEHGFASHIALAKIMMGLIKTDPSPDKAALTYTHQAITTQRTEGSGAFNLFFFLILAEAYQRAGHTLAGLQVLVEARAIMDARKGFVFEAEWHRIKGELLLQSSIPDIAQATACFQQAIEVARQQHAKWWELRAATRLAKLWHEQNQPEDAYHLLNPIYAGFTEQPDTPDLLEAKAVLDQLSRSQL